jgi:hypothetical protein
MGSHQSGKGGTVASLRSGYELSFSLCFDPARVG